MPPMLTPEILATLTPEVQAIIRAVIGYYENRDAITQARIAELEQQLADARKTPQNSSVPPSTEHPHAKTAAKKSKSPMKRGGQPGHKKHQRELIPTANCDEVVPLIPTECRRCSRPLTGIDDSPLRQQLWEIPEIKPHITEYRRHRLTCPCCGTQTCAPLPEGVPESQAGPNLVALNAMLMGCFKQSKRRVALFFTTVLKQPCSPGWVVKLQNQATAALTPAYRELVDAVPKQKILGADETPMKQGKIKTWLWTFVAVNFTLFTIRPSRKAEVPLAIVGENFDGVITCDRLKSYWACGKLQWCWAHLKRDFQAWADSPDGVVKRLGRDLLRETRTLFALWKNVRDGTLSRAEFAKPMKPVQDRVHGLLLRGQFLKVRGVSGSCEELYQHQDSLWWFVTTAGVEPTNNGSERALRPAVIWRKLSFGTQSEGGSRFVETMLSVVETCRQQNRNAFAFVRDCVKAHFAKQPPPQLLAGV
jgi:transposase